MTHFNKLKLTPILRLGFSNLSLNTIKSQKDPIFTSILPFFMVNNNYRLYSLRAIQQYEESDSNNNENNEIPRKIISKSVKNQAQNALLDYLHSTRCLQYIDAEYMSQNCPLFLRKIVVNVVDEPNVGRSMSRYLRYHPINEFEPFFESIGLDVNEFVGFLPRDLMYLSDEKGLLDNFHVLCEYGVEKNKIGLVFRQAREVFGYDRGVLLSKLMDLEELGLSRPFVVDVVSSCPHVLIGDGYVEFVRVLKRLKSLGYEYDWVKGCLCKDSLYNWRQIFELLCLLSDFACDDKEIGVVVGRCPDLLFDGSGRSTFSLIGLLLKFGCSKNVIWSMFIHFPSVGVVKFTWNLRRVCKLLIEIEMDSESIGNIVHTHLTLFGTLSMKKAKSILGSLAIGKRRLCDIIIENPLELKNYVLGAKVERLPVDPPSHLEKLEFLTRLGFKENSKQMEKAIKTFRGRGEELQERFDCIVQAGLSQKDVAMMIKAAPQILNQSKEVIEEKIRLLVDDLGYPLSDLKSFPGFICYTTKRIKLRYDMYKWLRDQRVARPSLSLSTFIACTEAYFMRRFVSRHPRGHEVWEEMKKKVSSV